MINWHRLFGLVLADLLAESPWIVELEKDLSAKRQLLDVVIVRRGPGSFRGRLPDGLEPLADHNLISYKSLHEPLDDWALKELTGHYVNYRKQVSPPDELLPEAGFRLLGISTRYPQKLASQIRMESREDGVYEVMRGTDRVTVIVLNEVLREDHHSFWHLFGGVPENVHFGAKHYRRHRPDTSTILNQLFESYQEEGVDMPYTIEDFRRDFTKGHLDLLSPEERLEGLPWEDLTARLAGLSLPKMEAVVEDLKKQIAQRKAATPSGKHTARRKQERPEKRTGSRRKRKGS